MQLTQLQSNSIAPILEALVILPASFFGNEVGNRVELGAGAGAELEPDFAFLCRSRSGAGVTFKKKIRSRIEAGV